MRARTGKGPDRAHYDPPIDEQRTDDRSEPGHHGREHRVDHDGAGWRSVVSYGRRVRKFWSSDINREVVARSAPTAGDTVLDIGAGMGAAVFDAARLVGPEGTVLAVEPTPFMRRTLALRRRLNRNGGRVEIRDGLAEDLPISSGLVDVAWAVNVLHHMGDLERAAAELARVMAPGGRVVLVDEDFDDPAHPEHEKRARRGPVHHGGDRHHGLDEHGHHHLMVDVEAVAATMRRHGFDPVDGRKDVVAGVPARIVTATRS